MSGPLYTIPTTVDSPSVQQGARFDSPLLAPPAVGLGLSPNLFQDRPARPADPVDATRSAESVPDGDDLRLYFQQVKDKWIDLNTYLRTGRRERLVRTSQLEERLALYSNLFITMSPAQQAMFTTTINETETTLQQLNAETILLDSMVEPETQWIKTELEGLAQRYPNPLGTLVKDYNWPTLQECQQLGLSDTILQMVQGSSNTTGYLRNDAAILQREIHRYMMAYRQQRNNNSLDIEEMNSTLSNSVSQEQTRKPKLSVIIPQFEPKNTGDSEYARIWIAKYDWYCQNLGCSEDMKMRDVALRLDGSAFTWFTALPPPTQKSWKEFSAAFLKKYAGGLTSSEAALKALKDYQKGDKPMHDFGTELTSLLHCANVFPFNLQMDYLMEKLPPRIAEAFANHDPQDLEEALRICTRLENRLQQIDQLHNTNKKVSNISPINTTGKITENIYQEQNYQRHNHGKRYSDRKNTYSKNNTSHSKETRTCYRCKKTGHLKKDCRVKLDRKQNRQQATQQQDNDTNIFSQFLQNNQTVSNNFQQADNTRFMVTATETHQGQQVSILVDTGSTISSITEQQAEILQLDQLSCAPCVIQYGNNSTQITDKKATLRLEFDNNITSTAYAYIVKQQNEGIILGMDWMVKEDICIHPKSKTFSKTRHNNQQDKLPDAEELIKSRYPNLIKFSEHQTITNAPFHYKIDTGDALPIVSRTYRRSPMEEDIIQKEVDKMLTAKVIVPSNSDWCSNVVLVKKPDGSYRFCIDYRQLNQITIKDKYPLPRIDDLIDRLQGSIFFSTIDLKSGYWQLPMDAHDAKKTAFIANGSLYHFLCLPFGVSNGPSHFMRYMHIVLKGLKNVMVYLDDIICYNKTANDHWITLNSVFKRLDDFNLKISITKCQFFKREVHYLGFLLSSDGIRSNPAKVEIIKSWSAPTSQRSLMRFLGFCVFYHKFIKNLSTVAKPLYTLLKKDQPFVWNDAAATAFNKLKNIIMTLPTLAYPDPQQPYQLHCDASNFGLGAALVQNGKPIAFASRTLTKAEINYSTTEKECLAIVWSLNHFHPYIFGATLTIYTDHAALKAILTTKTPKGRIARWIMELQSHRFTIVHKKGICNQDADALSRMSQNTQSDIPTADHFKKLQLLDPSIRLILKGGVRNPFIWKNNVLGRITNEGSVLPVIPRALLPTILTKAHDDNIAGHFGIARTLEKAKQFGWWPRMKEDVEIWVKYCEGCQMMKVRTYSTNPPLKPILPTRIGEIWAADVATLVTSKKGNRYMLVFMEYLSKWIVTAAISSLDTDTVVQVLLFEIVLKLQLPERLITDNGTNFISQAMQQVCERLGIKRSLTSVEAPQTDGLVERINRTIKTSLAICAKQDPTSWDDHLPFVTFAYNTATQESTGFSPFEVLFGVKARLPLLPTLNEQNTHTTEEWVAYLNNHLPLIHGTAIENIKKSQTKQKRSYNKGTRVKYNYKVGDLVARRNLVKTGGFPKQRWLGPYRILGTNNKEGTSFKILKIGDPEHFVTTSNARHLEPWREQVCREDLVSRREDNVTVS